MDSYTLNTVNYNYKTLSHEGFGGVCKYIATPKRIGYSRLLVKHENIQSACNTFMCSRLAELCDVYTPKAYLMSTSDETRRLFPMHPFIVGTEWVEDFSAVDYGSIEESPALRQQYWGSMALYAMFCRIADTPQFAYSPAKGFAYDWDEAFDVTDFVIKLQLKHTAIADKLNGGVVDLTAGVHTGINVFLGSSLNGQRSLNVLNAILREREYSIAHRARSCAATEIVDLEPLPDSTAGFRRYRTTADHKAPCVQGPAVLHVDTASLRQTQQTIVPGHIARGATCCRFVAAAYPRVFFAIFVRVTPGRCPTGRVVEI